MPAPSEWSRPCPGTCMLPRLPSSGCSPPGLLGPYDLSAPTSRPAFRCQHLGFTVAGALVGAISSRVRARPSHASCAGAGEPISGRISYGVFLWHAADVRDPSDAGPVDLHRWFLDHRRADDPGGRRCIRLSWRLVEAGPTLGPIGAPAAPRHSTAADTSTKARKPEVRSRLGRTLGRPWGTDRPGHPTCGSQGSATANWRQRRATWTTARAQARPPPDPAHRDGGQDDPCTARDAFRA